jgi:beta-mannosidase
MTYGWDFCPRIIHQGIWRPVTLVTAGAARIEDVWARPKLTDDLASARVHVAVDLHMAQAGEIEMVAEVAGLTGVDVRGLARHALAAGRSVVELELDVANPPLWWPNGHGPAPMGRLEVRVAGPDGRHETRSVPLAFRRIELVPNEGGPAGARPYTFRVNGRRIYAKGWNWVPHDIFHGVPRPGRIEHLTRLLADANVNVVRVWGGGLIETREFYAACDRRGLMVWQEFIQSSSGIEDTPSADPAWVETMTREAEAIVPLRRNHPSLALWCGGNELQDADGPLDDERSPVLRALGDVVRRLDPNRAWLPTSPTGPVFLNRLDHIAAAPDGLHDVHGPWEHQGLGGQYELANRGTGLLNSEFGVEGMANRRVHEALIPPERRWPAGRANPVYRHLGDWWNNEPLVQASFGGHLDDLDALRRASQHLQASGLGYAVEANRRRWPRNSGSLPWQFNEPYPFAWSTCAVDHRGDPKPSYFAVRRAYAPVSVTAAFDRAALDGGTEFEAAVWVIDDRSATAGATVTATLVAADGERIAERTWQGVEVADDRPVRVGDLRAEQPDGFPALFLLDLRLETGDGTVLATNRYTFGGGPDLAPMLDLQPASLAATTDRDGDTWQVHLRHAGGPVAFGVLVADDRPVENAGWVEVEDGGFDLLPGETRSIRVRWADARAGGRSLRIEGWNVDEVVVR